MSTQIILKVLALRHRLRQRDRWTRRQLEEHQGGALHRLREHAYARSSFYGPGYTPQPLADRAGVFQHEFAVRLHISPLRVSYKVPSFSPIYAGILLTRICNLSNMACAWREGGAGTLQSTV